MVRDDTNFPLRLHFPMNQRDRQGLPFRPLMWNHGLQCIPFGSLNSVGMSVHMHGQEMKPETGYVPALSEIITKQLWRRSPSTGLNLRMTPQNNGFMMKTCIRVLSIFIINQLISQILAEIKSISREKISHIIRNSLLPHQVFLRPQYASADMILGESPPLMT